MERNPNYPFPQLALDESPLRSGQPLALRVEVINPTDQPLAGASAELTLELLDVEERGVLHTWRLALGDVPAKGSNDDAVSSSTPDLSLPANVATGRGHLEISLTDADGRFLNSHLIDVDIVGERSRPA